MTQQTDQDVARAAMLSAGLAPDGLVDLGRLRQFVPAEWVAGASVGLDGVVRVSRAPATAESPSAVQQHLDTLAPALSEQQLGGEEAVDVLEAGHRLAAVLEDARVHAARELAARTAEKALRLKGVTSPDELSRTALERWRTRSKSVAAAEIQVLTGMGRDTAREVVAIATAPDICRVPARQGLATGIARWDLVIAWWRRCSRMPHEASAVVSRALFGTDVPVDEAARERLTPEGELSTQPWAKKEFFAALEREARLQEGADPAAQEKKRAAQHKARDAYAVVDDDGSAQLVITGDIASVTAGLERLHTLAVKAVAEGDPRTLSQLRSDLARALVLHGTLPLPDLGSDVNFITPEGIQMLADVLSGTPAHELQVIVPWDVLTGHAAIVNSYPTSDPTPGATTDGGEAQAGTDADADASEGVTDDARPAVLEGVCRVLGRFSYFLSAAEVRRIAGRPGTTLYRLLMDPADGRCIERSVARYSPDAAMRVQVRAADVVSRAPGSTVPARRSDLDHVEEYLLGGPTSETNLQALDRPWHVLKTERFWDAVMDASRNVTWESFWGRLYRTRPHDFRQYLSRAASPPLGTDAPVTSCTAPADGAELSPDEQRHLASLLVYAALAHRAPGERLEARDDDPESDMEILGYREAIWLRQTTRTGRRRTGARSGTPTPEQLLAHDARAVLDPADWVSLGETDPQPGPDAPSGRDPRGKSGRNPRSGSRDDRPPPQSAPPPPF